jgi:transposase
MARRHKRLWTDEEKRSICHQTRAPGVSVAQVARRYAVNANLIFKWLRDPRFASEEEPGKTIDEAVVPEAMRFLPVELVAGTEAAAPGHKRPGMDAPAPPSGGVIQIELAGGHRLRIEGAYDPDALARLLRGLAETTG